MIHRSSATRSIDAHIGITHVLRVRRLGADLSVVSSVSVSLGRLDVFQYVKNEMCMVSML